MPRSGNGSAPGVLSEQQEASVARAEGERREDDVGSEVTRPDTVGSRPLSGFQFILRQVRNTFNKEGAYLTFLLEE